MDIINATDLKIKGIGAIEAALLNDTRAIVAVRGQPSYVIMPMAEYGELREAELLHALAQAKADIAAGNYTTSLEEHFAELDKELADGV